MRYALCAVALVGALLFSACAPFGADPTPAPDVAASQTEAAALRAVNDAQATLKANQPTLEPPATLTAGEAGIATIWAGATATIGAMDTEIAADYATATAIVAARTPTP